jgi:hypothetical protein
MEAFSSSLNSAIFLSSFSILSNCAICFLDQLSFFFSFLSFSTFSPGSMFLSAMICLSSSNPSKYFKRSFNRSGWSSFVYGLPDIDVTA